MKKTYLLISILFLASCISEKGTYNTLNAVINGNHIKYELSETIKNNYDYNQEDVIGKIKPIFLETTTESLVHEIKDIMITDDRIIISDNYEGGGVIIFDKNGKLIKRLKRGNGPGEINRILSVAFDHFKNQIIVLQSMQLLFFTPNGDYIDSRMIDFPVGNIICAMKDGYIFSKSFGHEYDGGINYKNNSTIVTDRKLKIKCAMIPYPNEFIFSTIGYYNGKFLNFAMQGSDTIYTYRNDSLIVKYILDYSKVKTDISKVKTMEEYMAILRGKSSQGLYFFSDVQETSTHCYFTLNYASRPYSIYINKKNNHIVSGLSIKNNPENMIPVLNPATTYKDTFVSIYSPSSNIKCEIKTNKYLSEEDIKRFENLDKEDNPVILLYTLKDF